MRYKTDLDRFDAYLANTLPAKPKHNKFAVDSPRLYDDCMIWKGARTKGGKHKKGNPSPEYYVCNPDPYPQARVNRKLVRLHRWVYKIWNNKPHMNKSTEIHHLCHNTLCINPTHLHALDASAHAMHHSRERKLAKEEAKRNGV